MRTGETRGRTIKSRWKGLCQAAIILATVCFGTAQASVIPQPVVPYGTDSVRLPDGFQCSSATSPSSYMDMGIYQTDESGYRGGGEKGVYFRLLIPVGSSVKRIDCSKLYEQALRERQMNKALDSIKSEVFK